MSAMAGDQPSVGDTSNGECDQFLMIVIPLVATKRVSDASPMGKREGGEEGADAEGERRDVEGRSV